MNNAAAEKIYKLPADDIAESIGRMPGISLLREAGEANALIIRGLLPQYNKITIDGVAITSTDYDSRGIDLGYLSDMFLNRVEISKSLKADMDADALGGTVNLLLKSTPHYLSYDIKAMGGYKNLNNSYSNYKFSGHVSNRYFQDRLGVTALGGIELKQLPSDLFTAAYSKPVFNIYPDEYGISAESAGIAENSTERRKYSLGVILDYSSKLAYIKFINIFNQKSDSNITRDYTSLFERNELLSHVYMNETTTKQRIHSIQAKFFPGETELPVSFSYIKGEKETPNGLQFDFLQTEGVPNLSSIEKMYADPVNLMRIQGVQNPDSTKLWNIYNTNTRLLDETV